MDCTVHGVTKSWTQLSHFHFLFMYLKIFNDRISYKRKSKEIILSLQLSITKQRTKQLETSSITTDFQGRKRMVSVNLGHVSVKARILIKVGKI